MKSFFRCSLLVCTASVFIVGCTILNQLNQMKNFARCEFRLKTVENARVAGIDVQNKTSIKQLNLMDGLKFANAVASNSFPLTLTLNIEVKNPNNADAGMNRLEWRVFIDDNEIVAGFLNNRIVIAPNGGVTTLPLQIQADLRKVLSGRSAESLGNFAMNLAGEGNKPTRFMLRIKPTIDVLGTNIEYPDYFDVKMEFTADQGKAIRDGLSK